VTPLPLPSPRWEPLRNSAVVILSGEGEPQ
jgi:hypothetical protein